MPEDQLKKYLSKMPCDEVVNLCALLTRCNYVNHVAYIAEVFRRIGEESSDESRELLRSNNFVGYEKLFEKSRKYYDLAMEVLANDPA